MIQINKKGKTINVDINYNYKDDILLFSSEQLEQIKKSHILHYNIKTKIIYNIPPNILNIQFCSNFNIDILNYLHPNIKYLAFGNEFNKQVDNLPLKLVNLQFGREFNQNITNLPFEIKRLVFGYNFNQNVDYLPEGLEQLIFGHEFNQSIDNIPISIKYINFGNKFIYPITNLSLNVNLEQIYFCETSKFNHDILILPPNIKMISLPCEYSSKIILTSNYSKLILIRLFLWYPKENLKYIVQYNCKVEIFNLRGTTGFSFKKYIKYLYSFML
jgi:hypothetical protein